MKGIGIWIFVGVVLLAAMFGGVRLLFHGSAASADQLNGGTDNIDPNQIVAFGTCDVEKGVAKLYPRQFGNVVYVHEESSKTKVGERVKVKKDDVLLQIDDGLAKLKVVEAEAAVKAAEQQLEEAKTLPQLYKLQKEQQQSSIKAVELEIEKFKKELDTKLASLDETSSLAKLYRELAKFGEDQLKEKKKAEESKLKQIDLQNADLKIKQAEADVDAKKALLKQAKENVSYYKIVAPSNGYVLRVLTREGETLGPNPMQPAAIEFVTDAPIIVRAEVLQEWGRYVKPGATVVLEDDTYKGPEWKGVVKSMSQWYAGTRSPVIEPFRYNDVRTLECIIEITDKNAPRMIGQRVRARIKIEK